MPPCNKQQTIELDSTTWTALNELALAIHASRGVDMLQKETLEGTTGLVPHRIAMFDLIEAAGSDAHATSTRKQRNGRPRTERLLQPLRRDGLYNMVL